MIRRRSGREHTHTRAHPTASPPPRVAVGVCRPGASRSLWSPSVCVDQRAPQVADLNALIDAEGQLGEYQHGNLRLRPRTILFLPSGGCAVFLESIRTSPPSSAAHVAEQGVVVGTGQPG